MKTARYVRCLDVLIGFLIRSIAETFSKIADPCEFRKS